MALLIFVGLVFGIKPENLYFPSRPGVRCETPRSVFTWVVCLSYIAMLRFYDGFLRDFMIFAQISCFFKKDFMLILNWIFGFFERI